MVAAADPKWESALESLSRVAMLSANRPQPETQAIIQKARARVDFLREEFGVVGEADGLAGCERRSSGGGTGDEDARLPELITNPPGVTMFGPRTSRNSVTPGGLMINFQTSRAALPSR